MLIDTHCHLNFKIFDQSYDNVVRTTLGSDTWMVVIGTNFLNSKRACDIAVNYDQGVYATVGLHPVHLVKQEIQEENIKFTTTGETFNKEKFKTLIMQTFTQCPIAPDFEHKHKTCGRVVAVGETGLDYYYINETDILRRKKIIDLQKRIFTEHISLASELKLPLVIHARGDRKDPYKVYNDIINILEVERLKHSEGINGVIHAFHGTLTQAHQFINMGFYLGINGIIFNNHNMAEFLKDIPISKLVLETDSPFYLSKETINEPNLPINVEKIANELAQRYSLSVYEISQITTNNALNLYNLVM